MTTVQYFQKAFLFLRLMLFPLPCSPVTSHTLRLTGAVRPLLLLGIGRVGHRQRHNCSALALAEALGAYGWADDADVDSPQTRTQL